MPTRRFTPHSEPLEPRITPSPTLTTYTHRAALAEVRSALGTLARTGDRQRALAELSRTAGRIPYGPGRLLPIWESKLLAIGPRGSGLRAQRQMLLALNAHLHRGIDAGALRVLGPAAAGLAQPRLDGLDRGLLIVNQTNKSLQVALTDPRTGKLLFGGRLGSNSKLYIDSDPPVTGTSLPPESTEVTIGVQGGPPPTPFRFLLSSIMGKTVVVFNNQEGNLALEVEQDGFPR